MREDMGLFRGKRLDNGEWVEGNLLCDYNGVPRSIADFCGYNHVDPATVGEYTGLKDKNGKRIFEGDVVRMLYADDYSEIGEIAWSTGLLRYVFLEREGAGCHIYSIDTTCKMEWLATIHDNPELLEV